jgi:hypothetical protein
LTRKPEAVTDQPVTVESLVAELASARARAEAAEAAVNQVKGIDQPPTQGRPDLVPLQAPRRFSVELQPRHAEWLLRFAAAQGNTPERQLELFVRAEYARDPSKAGTAGGATGKARDFVPAAGTWKA